MLHQTSNLNFGHLIAGGDLEKKLDQNKSHVLVLSADLDPTAIWTDLLDQPDITPVVAELDRYTFDELDLNDFDLLILDTYALSAVLLELPRRLRTYYKSPILVLTNTQDEAQQIAAYRAGFDECIVRPIPLGVLAAKVTAWLYRSRCFWEGA